MLEATVSAIVALGAGGAAITNRLHGRINGVHNRINELDKRIDGIELRVAQEYVSKADLAEILRKMESHMIRIENKLDQIVIRNG
jgi:bacterioferritin (cytochrome b1)